MASATPKKDAAAKAADDKSKAPKPSSAKAATGEKKPAAQASAKASGTKASGSKTTTAKATATSGQKPSTTTRSKTTKTQTPVPASAVPATKTETVWNRRLFGLPVWIVVLIIGAVLLGIIVCAVALLSPASSVIVVKPTASPATIPTVPPLAPRRPNAKNWKMAIAAMEAYPDIRTRLEQLYGKNFVASQLARLAYDQDNGKLHLWKAPKANIPFKDTNYGSNLEDGRWSPFQNYTTAGQEFLTWTDGRPALRVGCLNGVDFTQLKKPPASAPKVSPKPRHHHVTPRHKPRPRPKPKAKHCTDGIPGTGLTSPGTPGDPLGYH